MKNIIHKMCENPLMSNIIRNTLEGGMGPVRKEVKKYINQKKGEKVLDVACGTGEFCEIVEGEYVGIDIDEKHIDFAISRYAALEKTFKVMNAKKLAYKNNYFTHAMLLSFLHHTSSEDIGPVLKEVCRVTKDRLIFVDLIPHKYNFIGNIFLALDQGKHMRELETQVLLLEDYLAIEKAYAFRSGINIHSLIVGRPKK